MFQGGFFSRSEVGAGASLERLTGCGACGLYKDCESPKMEAQGKGEKGILIISEIPCEAEDRQGRLGAGDASKLLAKKLKDFGVDVDRDCRKIPAVCCRTPKGRAPTGNEIAQCRPRVQREIEEFKPSIILLLGGAALESFLGDKWPDSLDGIHKWRGWTIPDRDTQAWVCPMFHPSAVLKALDRDSKQYSPVTEVIFDQDLHGAMGCLDNKFPRYVDERSLVEIVMDQKQLVLLLENMSAFPDPVAIDFETTGLKPHAKGHAIISCSLSTSDNKAWVFSVEQMGGRAMKAFRELLADPRVQKRAHNAKFEDNWSAEILKVEIQGWEWCSMIGAHLLDNRPGITGLKFQSYVQFGLLPYDEHIKPYLKSSEEDKKLYGANAFNNIRQAPFQELLIYNGLDTILEYRLAERQMARFR